MRVFFYETYKMLKCRYLQIIILLLFTAYFCVTIYEASFYEPPKDITFEEIASKIDSVVDNARKNQALLEITKGNVRSFDVNYQKEVIDVYEHLSESLKDSSLNTSGWDLILIDRYGAIVTMAILLFSFCEIFTNEQKHGFSPLLNSTIGKRKTLRSKLCMIFFLAWTAPLLVIISRILICCIFVGIQWNTLYVPVQYVFGFSLFPYPLMIFQYLILIYFCSGIALSLFGLIVSLITSSVKMIPAAYFCNVLFFVTGIVGHLLIDFKLGSYFILFDIVYFMLGNDVFIRYRALNFFNSPVDLIVIVSIVYSFVNIILSFLLFSVLNARNGMVKVKNHIFSLSEYKAKSKVSTDLFGAEMRKQFINIKFLVFMLVLIFIKIVASMVYFTDSKTTDEQIYTDYATEFRGVISQQTLKNIDEKQNTISRIINEMPGIDNEFSAGRLSMDEYIQVSNSYSFALAHHEPLKRIHRHAQYLIDKKESSNIPVELFNDIGWNKYFSLNTDIILLLAILCLSSSLYLNEKQSSEYGKSFICILRTTKNGREKLFLYKIILLFMGVFAFNTIFAMLDLFGLFHFYGFDGIISPLASIEIFYSIDSGILIIQFIIIQYIMRLLISFIIALSIYAISVITLNFIFTFFVGMLVFTFPKILTLCGLTVFKYIDLTTLTEVTVLKQESSAGVSVVRFTVLSLLMFLLLRLSHKKYTKTGYEK